MSTTPPLGSALRVPASHGGRTLVLCFDGTWDSFDKDNSNVVQFVAMLKKNDPTKQLVYYQAGVGTYTSDVLRMPIIEGTSKFVDAMIAWNMPEHIKDGYHFLMQNYREGDKICLFGFSRGAFTARALAGMLQKVGLLPPWNREELPFAYKMYAKNDEEGWRLSKQFKRTFSTDVKIEFLGVWETVQSVGLISKHLPFCNSNNAILHFRHALGLDERRVKYIPSFYFDGEPGSQRDEVQINDLDGSETDVEEVFFAGVHCDIGGGSVKNGTPNSLARIPLRWMIRECFKLDIGILFDMDMLENEVGLDTGPIRDALSSHEPSEALSSLKPPKALPSKNLPLIEPDNNELQGFSFIHIPVAIIDTLGSPFRRVWTSLRKLRVPATPPDESATPPNKSVPTPTPNGEAHEELVDARSPVYDQYKRRIYWKILDHLPWVYEKSNAELSRSHNKWTYGWIWNCGKGRKVYQQVMPRGMKVHRSVETRLLAGIAGGKPYRPKIRCEMHNGEIRRPTRDEWLVEPTFDFTWVD